MPSHPKKKRIYFKSDKFQPALTTSSVKIYNLPQWKQIAGFECGVLLSAI